MKFRDVFASTISNLLPKRVVYWCLIKAGSYGTTGKYSNTDTSAVTFLEILKRFGEDHNL